MQIHSLTARSVPRQFREDLRKEMPLDKNIRLPSSSTTLSTKKSTALDQCTVIYDSQHRDRVPYPDAEFIRTPSPEHTGIPAGPVKMPPIRSWQSSKPAGYTSDDSNASQEFQANNNSQPVKPSRRKNVVTKQNSNNVKSLVEKYNC